MPMFTLHRDYILRTDKGHSISFKKGAPVWVPPICIHDVVAIGGVAVDGQVDVIGEEVKPVPVLAPDEREKQLFKAFDTLIATSKRGDFTASGLPHIKKLEELVGFEVSNSERDLAWLAFSTAKAA